METDAETDLVKSYFTRLAIKREDTENKAHN